MNDFERWLESGRWVPDFVEDILMQYDQGIPVKKIAEDHNVSCSTIRRLVKDAKENGYCGNTKQDRR